MATNESTPTDDKHSVPAADIEGVRLTEEMEQSYIDYSMSVIAGRALPDVRDGLKPVHRRILYAMYEDGVTPGSSHRKSSSIVGTTMGDFHPHGDSAIYDTLARMAQDFSMRQPLVDGQGNFGSIDGDPPAAMRYTEARMAPIAQELLDDLGKETVDWQSNYDDRLEEPGVLPAAYPNLLVNGSSGIAVGMSTEIPPHNLGEVVDATVHLIDNPDADVSDLMNHVKGPDFPTGANIVGRDDIYSAYKTGKGRLTVRAEVDVEESQNGRDKIVVTEIPYQKDKSKLVEKIADKINDGKIEGVSTLRDESDRNGVRIVLEVKKKAQTDVVKNQLFSETKLETTFSVINLALVDGHPEILSLKEILNEYISHRKEVVRRRSEYELAEAEDRAHILEGRLKALENAEDIVELIRDSESRDDAKDVLQEEYGFSAEQVKHIVSMQLGSLTSMERGEIESEYESVQNSIDRLNEILDNEDELLSVIKDELRDLKEQYATERRTDIVEDVGTVTDEDLIPEEDIVVVLSEDDYLKRMPADEFDTQNRAGKGIIGANLKNGDAVAEAISASTHDTLVFVTDGGDIHTRKGYQIPEYGRTARGTSAVNLLKLDDGEELTTVLPVEDFDADRDAYLSLVTRNGYIKRMEIGEFENILSTGIIGITLGDNDRVVDATVTSGDGEFIVATREGKVIRFDEGDVRPVGRTARGVSAIQLAGDNRVVGFASVAPGETGQALLTVTENGYGKQSPLSEYRNQSRNGKGLLDIDTGDRNGKVVDAVVVTSDDELTVMSQAGNIIRMAVSDISRVSRNTKGVQVMSLDESDTVATISPSTPAPDEDEEADGDTSESDE